MGALSAGVGTVNVNPTTLGGRVSALAEAFGLFRWDRFRFRLRKCATLGGTAQAVGWAADVIDAYPSNVNDLLSMGPATMLGQSETVASDWADVPQAILRGSLPWYKSLVGATDPWEEIPGQLVVLGNSAESFYIEYHAIASFRDPLPTGSTPQERRSKAMAREKERVLRLLAEPTSSPVETGKLSSQKLGK